MTDGPIAIPIRLSWRQVSLIWPGLRFVISAELTRKERGVALCSYPLWMQPLPPGFDSGKYSARMMSSIDRLWDSLGPMLKTGGRLHLDTFAIRSAVLAVRLTLQVRRFLYRNAIDTSQRALNSIPRHDRVRRERISAELKSLREGRQSELPKLKAQTDRLVETLERLDKRATRRFVTVRSKLEFDMLSLEWQAHVRWIRFNLAYLKPLELPPDLRIMQRRRIDKLVTMAKEAIERSRTEMPNEKELRRIARAFVRSCKQGNQGKFHHLYMVQNSEDPTAQNRLFEFFAPRIGAVVRERGSERKEPKWTRRSRT